MATLDESRYARITLIDLVLAAAYYPILIDIAMIKDRIEYGKLVLRAKEENPKNDDIQNAIAVNTGRRLDVVRVFTDERDFPDLTSLVVNKSTGECSAAYLKFFDPVAERDKVYKFDWNSKAHDFSDFLVNSREKVSLKKVSQKKRVTGKLKITEAAAINMVVDYYRANKELFKECGADERDAMAKMIMNGSSLDEAFNGYRINQISSRQ